MARPFYRLTQVVFGVILISKLCVLQSFAQTTQTWVGAGNWSNAANWSPVGSPSGNRLSFENSGNPMSNNDLTNQVYRRIFFSSTATQSFLISGNEFRVSDLADGSFGWILNGSNFLHSITAPLFFDDIGKISMISTKSSGGLNLGNIFIGNNVTALRIAGDNALGAITVSGNISGGNQVVIGEDENSLSATETRVFFNNSNSGMSGPLRIQSGILRLQHSNAIGFVNAPPLEVSQGALLELAGNISLPGRAILINGNGISNVSGNNAIAGDVLIGRNSTITSLGTGSLTLGNIGKSGSNAAWDITLSGTGSVTLNGTLGIVGGTLGNVIKTGTGVLTINNQCAHTGNTSITNSGIIQLGGDQLLPFNAPLSLNTGTLISGQAVGYNQSFGAILKSGSTNSGIILGNGDHALVFAPSYTENWTGTGRIVISNWQGTAGLPANASSGKIYVESPDGGITPGLTDQQLAQISFAGFCDGAALLPDGELVPAKIPFISNVRGANPSGNPGIYAGYIGTTVTITGCRFLPVTEIQIGSVSIFPPAFSKTDATITFTLTNTMNGLITLITPDGNRVSPQSFTNLGYISSAGSLNWMANPTMWLGGQVPQAGYPVAINHGQVMVTAVINNPNPSPPNVNEITIQNSGRIRLLATNVFPSTTPLVLDGGTIRLFNHTSNNETNPNNNPGFSQNLGTLRLIRNSGISLGAGSHTLRFANSSSVIWDLTRTITINNWKGPVASPGTEGRVFFGNNASGLTEQQLARIRFAGYCPGAKLLSTGELVPSDAPFITSITSDPGGIQGSTSFAYYNSTVRLDGCQFEDVDYVTVGVESVTFTKPLIDPDGIPATGDEYLAIEFVVNENLSTNLIRVLTATDVGVTSNPLRILGYISNGNGVWNNATTWLGGTIPPKERNAYISHQVTINSTLGEDFLLDSLVVSSTGTLAWGANTAIEVKKAFINNGTIQPALNSQLIMAQNAVLINHGSFISNDLGTVSFLGRGTIDGTVPITFNNLTINQDTLFIPRGPSPNLIPTITGNYTINGGVSWAIQPPVNTSVTQVRGPIYAPGSNLVYNMGGTYARGREWNGNQTAGTPGRPFNVIVQNGTILTLGHSPSLATPIVPEKLYLDGDLRILNGEVIHDMNRPLEVFGSLQIGADPSNIGVLTLQRNHSSGFIEVNGNYIRHVNSTFNAQVGSRKHRIVFKGNQPAIISTPGEASLPGVPTESFFHMVLEPNKIITLNNTISIIDSLELGDGILNTTNAHLLVIEPTAIVKGGNATSFINGPMRKITAASPASAAAPFEFKIGKRVVDTNYYRPVWVSNYTHNGTTAYTAEAFLSETLDPPFGPIFIDAILTGVWKNRWWQIEKSGDGSARVGIPYAPGVPFALTDPEPGFNIAVVRYDDELESWKFTKPAGAFNNATHPFPEVRAAHENGMVYSNILDQFSPFTIGYGFSNPLPVTLLNFSANLKQTDVLLQWEIADNQDLRYFEIEHSINGQQFAVLGREMPAQGTQYHYTHFNIAPGVHYYRLRITEKDGSFKYSKVEVVQYGVQVTVIHGLLQNPVQGPDAKVKIYSASAQTADAVIMDMSGRVVMQQKIGLMAGENISPLSVMPLPKGMYKLAITTRDGKRGVYSMLR